MIVSRKWRRVDGRSKYTKDVLIAATLQGLFHGSAIRRRAELFGISEQTLERVETPILMALVEALSKDSLGSIKMPQTDSGIQREQSKWIVGRSSDDSRNLPFFGCIGAIDG